MIMTMVWSQALEVMSMSPSPNRIRLVDLVSIVTMKKLLLRQLLVMRLIANQANSPK